MRTIIIAEENLIDDIKNNPVFFDPLQSHNDVLFCKWDVNESSVANAVPELKNCVGECNDWRAIIVCDESGVSKRNPFDVVEYADPEKKDGLSDLEFIQKRRDLRLKAFDKAATMPLTRLVTLLCDSPEIGDGLLWSKSLTESAKKESSSKDMTGSSSENDAISFDQRGNNSMTETARSFSNDGNKEEALEDFDSASDKESHRPQSGNNTDRIVNADRSLEIAELEEYRQEANRKQELRSEILLGVSEHFNKPSQVICIAKRDYQDEQEFLHTTWTPHLELQYSNFYNFNMYFDKMRYLIFDISSRNTESERLSDLKFEYALMLIACNALPENCLRPNRVYMADCVYDPKALEELLTEYYEKLTGTAQKIEKEIQTTCSTEKEELSDQDAENLFHSDVTIPVMADSNFNEQTLFADCSRLGLAGDCPTDELAKWESEKSTTMNALMRYLKLPRRAIRKAAQDMRELGHIDSEDANRLNEFQIDDLEETMENQEIAMVSSSIPNVFDTERYRKRLEEASEEVKKKEKTRMSRSCTIGVGVCVLVLFLIGLLPMWLGSLSEPLVIPGALIMIGVALVLLALTGFVCLFFLRHALIQKWEAYNQVMHEVVSDINRSMAKASEYISLVCRFLQEHTALMWAKYQELPQKSRCHTLENHLADIYNQREFICDAFGELVHTCEPDEDVQIYDYDFLRNCTYKYPLPVEADQTSLVTFMETGYTVEVPYRFMESLTVRRVELYD